MKSENPLDAAANKLDDAQRKYFSSEKGKDALRRYFGSEQGKQALRRAQATYYRKQKALLEFAKQCEEWLEQNPGKTVEDFLEGIQNEQNSDNR